eukprot:14664377-Alexandrium_andersonii.AAC.1
MSASLVGSEMCIRDSDVLLGVERIANSAVVPEPEEHVAEKLGERAAAVSYTHLTLPTICSV